MKRIIIFKGWKAKGRSYHGNRIPQRPMRDHSDMATLEKRYHEKMRWFYSWLRLLRAWCAFAIYVEVWCIGVELHHAMPTGVVLLSTSMLIIAISCLIHSNNVLTHASQE